MMHFFDILGTSQGWMYLFILSILEIVLGIDNVIFVSIIVGKLPAQDHAKARKIWVNIRKMMNFIV